MRESDGTHFLWNGEGCVRISPTIRFTDPKSVRGIIPDVSGVISTTKWHHDYGELPVGEIKLLNVTMQSRNRGFTIEGYGRYQVVARGQFKDVE